MAPIPKECDYLVIGGGSGGLASGRRAAAKYGAKVIAIENDRLGGTCVNVGCVPKKVTWHAAAIAETIQQAKAYCFDVKEQPSFDWKQFKGKRDAFVERLNGIYARNLNKDNVEYLHGTAQFVGKQEAEITLDDGSKQLIKAKHVLVAVGGHPTLPNIPGSELAITSDGFFALEKQPKKVATVGAGYIGVELSGMFNALGTETHFFIRGDTVLRSFDTMIQETITKEYERQGVNMHKQSSIKKIEDVGNGQKRITYEEKGKEQTMEVDEVLFAVGRTPKLANLGLDKLGDVKVNSHGHIMVDEFQNTSVENVYSIGDACDKGFELTPVAIAAGRRLSDRLFGGLSGAKLEYENIPSVVFAHPEVGSVGISEEAARKKYGNSVKVYKTEFRALYFSMMDEEEKQITAYKIVCEGENERVVGLHLVGLGSAEALQGFGVAIRMGATKKDFDNCVAIHPVSAEELVTMT